MIWSTFGKAWVATSRFILGAKTLTLGGLDTLLISGTSGSAGHSLPQLVLRSNDTDTPDGAGGFLRFQSPSDAGTIRDGVQINGGLVDATDGAEDGLIDFAIYRAGSAEVALTLSGELAAFFPGSTNDVYSLGTDSHQWADIHLGSGGRVRWAAGDAQIRHSTNVLFFEGASTGYAFDNPAIPSFDGATSLGTASFRWTTVRAQQGVNAGAPVTKTADFTVAATEHWLINNKSGSACVVVLPSAASFSGRQLHFTNYQAQRLDSASSNVVPLAGGAAGTAILSANAGRWAKLVSDGTYWITMEGVV